MTKRIFVSEGTKFPYGARLTLKYYGSTICGTCMGMEIHDSSYGGHMILKYDANSERSGHDAMNEHGETFWNCWWIEYGAEIIEVKAPFEPSCICDIL